ncbi:TetR/AcrR family transcriptional regulator [Streptomyces sp. WMMC905]|uniref:TetR/AcrR family transcriptional regulator n=1 Tax=Streptomyces sp. WMMC905 TaxID=3404123 RepID=UPI003B938482
MTIARAAAALFVRRGPRATRTEDIARSAGVSPRTFYRYFATKEEAVVPLYAAGSGLWTAAVREAPAELDALEALEYAVRHTLTPGREVPASSWEWARGLIRLADDDTALAKVWAEVCHTSEKDLAAVLAERTHATGREDFVAEGGATELPGRGHDGCGDGSADGADPRFVAATAAAAVRVAVERWAASDGPPDGPDGPAALALRNLATLRGLYRGNRGPSRNGTENRRSRQIF